VTEKLDLENPNVIYLEMSRERARGFFDSGELGDDFETGLDEAQGKVGSGSNEAFLVIRITP
jgi:hypothetical protein